MQITVSGHQLEVTPTLRNYVLEKLERIQRHFDQMTTTNIVLHVEKARHLAEATISARGTMLHANAEADDMYAAIDQLASKLDRQVRRHKDKVTDHHRGDGGLKDRAPQ